MNTSSNSPTLSLAATQAGIILGTAAYMTNSNGTVVDGCTFASRPLRTPDELLKTQCITIAGSTAKRARFVAIVSRIES